MSKRIIAALCLLCLLLSGCGKETGPASGTFFAMNTVINLTIYPTKNGATPEEVLTEAETLLGTLEKNLSVTDPEAPLSAVNRDGWGTVPIETGEVAAEALRLCDWTGGALDVTLYPVSLAWGFTTENHRVPPREELDALLEHVDYRRAAVAFLPEEQTAEISLPDGMEMDLGAVAKGYAGNRLRALLLERMGEDLHALLDLGGNVVALGGRPDGDPWRVGIRDPENTDGLLGVLGAYDAAVITSGGYERYFEENGVRYWHILDPATGEPARSGLKSVTVVGSPADGMTCDALSTALFVMGLEKAAEFWRDNTGFELILVSDDGGVTITEGLRDSFSLSSGHGEATVLERQ